MHDFVYSHDSECMCSCACIYVYCVYRCACLMSGPVSVQVYIEYSSVHLHLQATGVVKSVASGTQMLELKSQVKH